MVAERLYSQDEAAEILQVSKVTLGRWLRAGKVRAVKVGRSWRIPESSLDEVARKGIVPVTKAELAMRVRSKIEGSNYSYRCNECGNEWFPMAGGSSGEEMLKMICSEGCNKPEGFDEEEEGLRNEWFENNEEAFQEYLAASKEKDGKGHLDDEEDGADYASEVRSEWEKETREEREMWIDEQMALWMENEFRTVL